MVVIVMAGVLWVYDMLPRDEGRLSSYACEQVGGRYDGCASPCGSLDDEQSCMTVCVQACFCETSDQCPEGFVCSDENMGRICSPE